ncbi:LCP family protein [Streptomyces monticola]|uniref:LCP family protein n=1 Tax=Streptomyces monticola TaxID=2666263 RepID=A0ABW2JUU7_9ACTN
MTDTAGTPAGPDQPDDEAPEPVPPASDGGGGGTPQGGTPGDRDSDGSHGSDGDRDSDGDGTPAEAGPARATPAPRKPHWLRWVALGAAVVVLAAAGIGWSLYKKLEGNITEDTGTAAELERYEKERPMPAVHDAQNILLIGSDTRAGDGNRPYGQDVGTQRSDTTILLHLSADRQSATAVSLPRDLMVDIPSCRKADGSRTQEQFAQFNWAFEFGGPACTIRTVEKLTQIRVDHHMIVDFNGFKKMVDAVDGVDVCLKEPVDDIDAKLKLPAGRQKLDGEQALGYVRARKTLGNGSDTDRMDRQQQFLAALVNKVQSNGVLLNPTRLYPVLDAATSSLTTDPAIAGLTDLYELVRSMRNIPTEQVQFLTVPRQSYTYDANRDELVQPDAGRLFDRLRNDSPVQVTPQKPDSSGQGEESGEDSGSATEEGSDSAESGGYEEGEEESYDGGYWSDEGYWVDEKPGDGKPGGREAGDGKPDDPAHTPSPAPTFRGNTAAGTTCE